MKVPKFFLIKGVQLLFRGGGWGRGQKSSANQILLGFSLDAPWMLIGCSLDARWMLIGCSLDAHWMLFDAPLILFQG